MLKKALYLVLALLLVTMPVYAAQQFCEGNQNSSGNCDISIDEDSAITFNGALMAKYEVATTSDTLTAAESGKTVLMNCTDAAGQFCRYTLPDANVGLEYTFTAVNGAVYYITPQTTDYLVGITNDNSGTTYAVGDETYNQGYTGDSLTVICGTDLYWYAKDVRGTFTDGN